MDIIDVKHKMGLNKKTPQIKSGGPCTDTGKLIEQIYSFQMIEKQILYKYEAKKPKDTDEQLKRFHFKRY